jgi:hypothetical protein
MNFIKSIFSNKVGNEDPIRNNKFRNFLRGAAETTIGGFDGAVQGLTGIDLIGEDYFETKSGNFTNQLTKNVAPMLAGAAAGAIGGPAAGKLVYGATNALGNANYMDPLVSEFGASVMSPKLYNIEKGELIVDPTTGDIIEDLDSPKYQPHSKNKSKEHPGNFISPPEGSVIIPKKDADLYRKNKEVRMGIIRNVNNLFQERMAYGVDSNGNRVEYSKLPEAPVARGGMPTGTRQGPLGPMYINYGEEIDPSQITSDSLDMGTQLHLGRLPIAGSPTQQFVLPTAGLNNLPAMANVPKPNDPRFISTRDMTNQDMAMLDFQKRVNNPVVPSIEDSDSMWTPGNITGMIGAGISGIGPLATTLARGVDRDEVNTYTNVGDRAARTVQSTMGRTRDEILRANKANINAGLNTNRTSSGSFSNMTARNQALLNDANINMSRNALQADLSEANALSGIYANADAMKAQGEERRQDRLDRNIDNYYSNISSNLSNLGVNVQGAGRELNKQQSNTVRLEVLKSISPYFDVDKDGNFTFKGKPLK